MRDSISIQISRLTFSSWVFSTSLSKSKRVGHSFFNPSTASKFKTMKDYTWDITYGDGSSASGTVGKAPVTIGSTTISNQAVEITKSVTDDLVGDTNCDGLLGLSFKSLNTVSPVQQTPFFFNALSSLSAPVFTANLKHDKAGSYDFGIIDSKKYSGDIVYTDVDSSDGYWAFTSPSYKVGNKVHKHSAKAIADTGTSLLLLEDAVVDTYYKSVKGAAYDDDEGAYTFPCKSTLPSFSVAVTEKDYVTIPGTLMSYGAIDDAGTSKFYFPLEPLRKSF
jgi:aspergillopepsin I